MLWSSSSYSKKEGSIFVHPFDDEEVITGQGTIAKEILEDYSRPIDAIFCCVGGGGLISGIAAYIKAVKPEIKIIGVEAQGADAMTQSLKANKRVVLDSVSLFAEGAALKQVGEIPFKLCQKYVDDMVVVDNDEICAAIKDVFEDKIVTEVVSSEKFYAAEKYHHDYYLRNSFQPYCAMIITPKIKKVRKKYFDLYS